MASPPAERAVEAPRKRRRSARSCQECRRRKVKCDRKEPCNHCILSKNHCIYGLESAWSVLPLERRNLPSFSPASNITAAHSSETANNQDITASGQIEVQQQFQRPESGQIYENEVAILPTNTGPSALNEVSELSDIVRRVRSLEQQLLSNKTSSPSSERKELLSTSLPKDTSHTQDKRLFLNKSRLYGRSHWSSGAHVFIKIAAALSGETGNSTDDGATRRLKTDIEVLLRKCKVLAKNMKKTRPSRCVLRPEPMILSGSRDFADSLAQLYISRFESAFRILHIPSFWSEYEQYWQNPTKTPCALLFKIQLVIAIGSSIDQELPNITDVQSRACEWVHAAQNWLSGPMEKDRLSMSGLQVHCLLILARQTLSIGADLIWVSMGTLVRLAMQLGLHRDPRHFTKMTILQAEVRRRLWATVLEMNLQAALDTGMPPAISLDDFDTGLPSNMNDKELEDCVRPLEPCPETTITDTSVQRLLANNLLPRFRILRCLNGVGSEMSYDKAIVLSSEVNKACNECSVYVKKTNHTESEIFRHNMVDLLLRRFLLSIHRPYASLACSNPRFYYSRKLCFDSALALLSPMPDQEFSRLVILGGGIFKNRIFHVGLALISELLVEIEEQGHEVSRSGSPSYMRILVDAAREARSQLAQRMQLGETNVRLYMKLGIAICQAEYGGSRTSLQQQMAQSAKDSLQEAYSTMQTNSGTRDNWLCSEESIGSPQYALDQELAYGLDFNDILRTTDFNIEGYFDSGRSFC